MKAYIIILNYKGWEDCIQCIKSVFASANTNFTVIVIDNDSRNESLEHVKEWVHKNLPSFGRGANELTIAHSAGNLEERLDDTLVLLQHETNLGFAGAINPVLKIIQGKDAYVWLLNPDIEVRPDTLDSFVDFASKHPGPFIAGAVIRYFENPEKVHAVGGGCVRFDSATVQLNQHPGNDLDYISGGCLFTKTATFRELGLLPEQYFLYWEETDFCYAAKLRGYKLLVAENAVCYDKISRSIGKNFLSDFYYSRNGLVFLQKYKPSSVSLAKFFMWVRILKRILSGRPDRAKGIYKGLQDFNKHYSDAVK